MARNTQPVYPQNFTGQNNMNPSFMSAPISQGVQKPSFWGGAPAGFASSSRYSPEQMQQAGQLGQAGTQALMDLAKNSYNFEDTANWARKNFQEKTLPTIMERFAQHGTGGNMDSGAYQKTLGTSNRDFELGLAGMKGEFDMKGQALNQNLYNSMTQYGQNPMWDQHWQERQGGFAENALMAGIQGLGAGAGAYMTGGANLWAPAIGAAVGGMFAGRKGGGQPGQGQGGQGYFQNRANNLPNLTAGKQIYG
jgi:hypothetical protein